MEIGEALQRALTAGMDLVEVSPNAKPPVCKILDYGKYMYAQRKKEQKSKAHAHQTELKEIRIKTPKIGDHDLMIKINKARDFLSRGDRVQFTLRFRGRELAHIDEGRRVFNDIQKALEDVSKVDQEHRFESKRLSMLLAPASKKPGSKDEAAPSPEA